MSEAQGQAPLRRGWTTGACASGAARAAFDALLTGAFPDPVPVQLPKGLRPEFALATQELDDDWARAGVVKDAGDDPDVTHGALVIATVRFAQRGAGVSFRAGEGVGVVTRPGLPLPPGEPAINPAPRAMIRANLEEVAARVGVCCDAIVEISVPGGEKIAERTANGRLGIVGGLSILGTTGVVTPYSCSAWIHSIQSGVDVARASGCFHVGAATGDTSEAAIRLRHNLPDHALIDMGDFAGGLLKYLRAHPIPRLTIAGGPGKMTKLAEGRLDLHSKRGAIDLPALARRVAGAGGAPPLTEAIARANSALHAFELAAACNFDLPALVAEGAWATAARVLGGAPTELETAVVGRDGHILATSGFRRV
ncbi:MAG TPA: cobalt-precorrin-5B (C(1))-methyltransferase [Roseiarcus sp.]|jgi:cobalt-precorrin-5B (C1)-methyltransferase|nr:cobalt-precorrin-5B (C(1))-methyltransferase [Roseiarcus sp.]